MKRTLGTLSVLALFAAPAVAGDYHSGANLVCSDCHIMHYSEAHDVYAPYTTPAGGYLGGTGPYTYLLRDEINNLCLACHGGTDTGNTALGPDVLEDNAGKYPTEVRAAGALNQLTAVNGAYAPETGHTLGSTDVAPGGTWSNPDGLSCTNCHSQHGREGLAATNLYKNLQADTNDPGNFLAWGATQVTYTINAGAPPATLTFDVWEDADPGTGDYAYDQGDVNWLEPDQTASAIATWCGGCHTNFHGAPGDANMGGVVSGASYDQWLRHPVQGVDIGTLGGGHSSIDVYRGTGTTTTKTNFVKVMSATGIYGATAPATVTPTCISCHKAHGNQNGFGLIYMYGTGTPTEEGDTGGGTVNQRYENLCGQCHVQGSAFVVQ